MFGRAAAVTVGGRRCRHFVCLQFSCGVADEDHNEGSARGITLTSRRTQQVLGSKVIDKEKYTQLVLTQENSIITLKIYQIQDIQKAWWETTHRWNHSHVIRDRNER